MPQTLKDTMLIASYNGLETVEHILSEHSDEMATIHVEPLQRIIFPQTGFLKGLLRLADQFGVLLIFEEVVSGFACPMEEPRIISE